MNPLHHRDNEMPPKSPHKMNRINKLRIYEDKSLKSIGDSQADMKAELERNFSPINSQKAFGLRIGGIQKANNT